MQHYIIAKLNDTAPNLEALLPDIQALFKKAEALPGVQRVTVHSACLHSEIRYDLMIVVDMEKNALAAFDASPIHSEWKERFAQYLKHKVIFDCE